MDAVKLAKKAAPLLDIGVAQFYATAPKPWSSSPSIAQKSARYPIPEVFA